MITNISMAMERTEVEAIIGAACDELWAILKADESLEVVLDVLLWARWIPSSDGEQEIGRAHV